MEEYSVMITPDAEKDLNELDDYISIELQVPEIATAYIAIIKQELSTLRTAPRRYRLVDDEPWHSRGVRRMNVKNFAAFYVVLDEYKEVYVQNIIYQKRDIPKVLLDLYRTGE